MFTGPVPPNEGVQYWRLLAHHLIYSNSGELFIWELLLYNVGISVERLYGSLKYAVGISDFASAFTVLILMDY